MGLLPREGKFLDPMADVVNVTAPAVTRSSR
jgi:phosphatidylglycerophosphate synthase